MVHCVVYSILHKLHKLIPTSYWYQMSMLHKAYTKVIEQCRRWIYSSTKIHVVREPNSLISILHSQKWHTKCRSNIYDIIITISQKIVWSDQVCYKFIFKMSKYARERATAIDFTKLNSMAIHMYMYSDHQCNRGNYNIISHICIELSSSANSARSVVVSTISCHFHLSVAIFHAVASPKLSSVMLLSDCHSYTMPSCKTNQECMLSETKQELSSSWDGRPWPQ